MSEMRFLLNQANKVEGLQYAGFETFKGSPYTSCARETGQNSRDASVSSDEPVRVSFNKLSIPTSAIPFLETLNGAIALCLNDPQDEKTRAHLERAHKHTRSSHVDILEISDTNTTGLTGPTDDSHSVFAALVKGDGVTVKTDTASSGSFGIGKNAAFAVSELQTVIYATCWQPPGSEDLKFAAQGRVRLISHNDGPSKLSAEGYWGNPNFTAIEDVSTVPLWMRRAERGTSIFAVGFRSDSDWKLRISLSLAANFFAAIERSDIEFSVDNESITIDQTSLDRILSDPELYASAVAADQGDLILRAKTLLECLRAPTETHQIQVDGLGDFILRVLVKTDLPREVHIIRNGIYITDNLARFGHPMKKFPGTKEFIAVLEPATSPAGRAASSLLKRIENPAHDALEPERIVDPVEQELAKKHIKKLHDKIRDAIRKTAKVADVSSSQLDELSHLFAHSGTDPSNKDEGGEVDPERFKQSEASTGNKRSPGGHLGEGIGSQRGGPAPDGAGSTRTSSVKKSGIRAGSKAGMPLKNVRSTQPASKSPLERTIHFTPVSTGRVVLAVRATGLSDDTELAVDQTSSGILFNGRISLDVIEAKRVSIDVRFSDPFVGPIDIFSLTMPSENGTPSNENI